MSLRMTRPTSAPLYGAQRTRPLKARSKGGTAMTRSRVAAAIFGLWGVTCLASGDDLGEAQQRATLRGLKRIIVLPIIQVDPKIPLTEDTVRVDTELRLRRAGVEVSDAAQWRAGGKFLDDYSAILNVRIMTQLGGQTDAWADIFGSYIDLDVLQGMSLSRDPSHRIGGSTWDRRMMLNGPTASASDRIRKALGELVDSFLNDYLAMNPVKR